MFIFIYIVVITSILIIFSPILIALSFLREKYKESIPSRFFLWKNRSQNIENSFWFHGCSLGEINALKPFVKEISKTEKVSITTTTDSGFNSSKSLNIEYKFLPFEPNLLFWTKKQKKLIVLEAELWLLLFFVAKLRGSKTALLSGRISDRSFPKYLKARWFYSKIFVNIDYVFAQSETDKQRFEKLGAKNIEILGNIKLLESKSKINLDIPKDKLIIVGASTHSEDEDYILEAFFNYGKGKLILVPRHQNRFDEVWKIVEKFSEKNSFSASKYSEKKDFNSDIILIDKIGMLVDIFAKSNIVILGGGFYDGIGGHNPVEPASFKNKIISGKYMFNQKELLKYISNIQIIDRENILEALQNSEKLEISKITQKIDFDEIVNRLLKF